MRFGLMFLVKQRREGFFPLKTPQYRPLLAVQSELWEDPQCERCRPHWGKLRMSWPVLQDVVLYTLRLCHVSLSLNTSGVLN